jgi:hypothetical protein
LVAYAGLLGFIIQIFFLYLIIEHQLINFFPPFFSFVSFYYCFCVKKKTNTHTQTNTRSFCAVCCPKTFKQIVISETSFESGMSDDYAVPPDAVSHADTTLMDASLPSLFMRTSYADSPNKKVEPLEKVIFLNNPKRNATVSTNLLSTIYRFIFPDWSPRQIGWQIENMAQTLVCPQRWHPDVLEIPT